jgi:L-amino acid N-acyltransferase YncA
MSIRYRFAQLSDSSKILSWRNEESVRLSSRNQALISIDQHNLWFAARVTNIQKEPILIFSNENTDIGFTRLDKIETSSGAVEVSIAVSPDLRHLGFGSLMLSSTIEIARTLLEVDEVSATVREGNQPSIKLFTASGFKVCETYAGFVNLKFSFSEQTSN